MSEKLKRGIYIIPNLFTCGNIACGYLSILSSMNGVDFIKAAWFLVFAIVCDIFDGRIARLTNTTSEFGIQFDSLCDLVSFGIAPSVMMYGLVLSSMGKLGIAVTLLFVLCSALRLAKFNVSVKKNVINNSFMGLPTPASAGVLVSFVLSYKAFVSNSLCHSLRYEAISIFVMVTLSLLMVSNIPYASFKKIKLSKPKAFRVFIFIILIIWFVVVFPQNIIFVLFTLYALSGIVGLGTRYYTIYRKKINLKDGENDND